MIQQRLAHIFQMGLLIQPPTSYGIGSFNGLPAILILRLIAISGLQGYVGTPWRGIHRLGAKSGFRSGVLEICEGHLKSSKTNKQSNSRLYIIWWNVCICFFFDIQHQGNWVSDRSSTKNDEIDEIHLSQAYWTPELVRFPILVDLDYQPDKVNRWYSWGFTGNQRVKYAVISSDGGLLFLPYSWRGGKWLYLKGNCYCREPFFTSMIMGSQEGKPC